MQIPFAWRGWPFGCETVLFGEGDAIDANSIRLLKVGILWRNPIPCSGNPLEENSILVEERAPLQRILFVMERGRPMGWISFTRRREPLSRRLPFAYSDTIRCGEGRLLRQKALTWWIEKRATWTGRTLPWSESYSHWGLEPHVAEPNLGSCWRRGPRWC